MLSNHLFNNRIFIVFVLPFILGLLSVLSFQPFNFTLINFLIIPSLFLIISFVRKKSKNVTEKNLTLKTFFS